MQIVQKIRRYCRKYAENLQVFASNQGRGQALNDLMELNYGFETTSCQFHFREENRYHSFTFLPAITVFTAINEHDVVF